MEVPVDLVPAIREFLAKRRAAAEWLREPSLSLVACPRSVFIHTMATRPAGKINGAGEAR
jgi:hypothetical protein